MGWTIKKIKDVALVTAGQSPEGKHYNADGVGLPFFQGKKEFGDKYIGEAKVWTSFVTKVAEKDDVLMSVRAPVGPVNFAIEKCCIGRGLASIRVTEKFDKDFLFLYFKHIENQLTGNTGAVFNSINKGQIENLDIPVPPLTEQQNIVEKLDFAFEAIEKAKANIEKNIQNAKELFQSKLNEIFSQKGEGWEEKKIEEVCESIVAGGDAPKNNFSAERNDNFPIPIYANAVKLNGLYGYTDLCKIKKPSLTIAARGSGTGFTCIRFEPFFPIVRLLVLTPNDSIDLQFLKLSVDNQVIKASGSAIPQFTVPMLKMLSIYLPKTRKEQEKIVSHLDHLSLQTDLLQEKYKQKLANLEELKKSILQKAFKGEF